MSSNLQLVKQAQFNGIEFNCYREQAQNDNQDFWATREQIGQLLEYEYPGESIGKIHNRNKARLDKFSRVSQIDLPSGGVQDVTIYNFKGLLEICRFSNQPKADEVMDFLWDIADEIRRTGSYNLQKQNNETPELKAAKSFICEQNKLAHIADIWQAALSTIQSCRQHLPEIPSFVESPDYIYDEKQDLALLHDILRTAEKFADNKLTTILRKKRLMDSLIRI